MQTLRTFREVAQRRSFSLAAEALGQTQSAASQRISQLERRLGVQLIDRSIRPLALTPAGSEYLRGCCELLDHYEALERQVSGYRKRLEGQVRVDAIYSAGIDLLNWVRASFEAKHPAVSIRVEYKRPDEVYEAVQAGQCDLGIVSYPQRWREVSVQGLRDEEMVFVCAPNHPLVNCVQVNVTELNGVQLIAFAADLPVARRIRQYFRDHQTKPRIMNVFDNIDTIKSAVALTGQAAILPKRTVQREVVAGVLSAVELTPRLIRPMGMIRPRRNGNGRARGAVVEAFIDFLIEKAGPGVDAETLTAAHGLVESKR